MTTTHYEERLRAFAEGKRLGRLTKAVRGPEDGVCDACGSSLPRTLFGLRDTVSGRHYFVGQNCLAWLSEMGLVARTRYRQSAEVAYRQEMEKRRNGANTADPESTPRLGAQTELPDQVAGRPLLRRTVLISESGSHYSVLIRIEGAQHSVSARAREPRWREEWARQDGGVLLERVRRPRRAALLACVLKAYRQALGGWRGATPTDRNGSSEVQVHEEVKP